MNSARLRELIHYDPLTGVFVRLVGAATIRAGDTVGNTDVRGYFVFMIDGRSYGAHRLAWLYMTGEWPSGEVDHINEIKNDNRWVNLRLATHRQNGSHRGRQANNTSGFKGVTWHKQRQKWQAAIAINWRSIYLGLFNEAKDAALAYDYACRIHHDKFAHLNLSHD